MKKIVRPVFFNFYADSRRLEVLRRLCKKNGISMSAALRQTMEYAIAKLKNKEFGE